MTDKYYDNFSKNGSPKGIMGDFRHAEYLYRVNNYRLAPKVKFLYHVVLTINPIALSQVGGSAANNLGKREFNLLVTTADLPSFSPQTETKIQYNRKKIIQTSMNYNSVSLLFHDDNAGVTTMLWEAYYRYYFQDGNYGAQTGTGRPSAYSTGLYGSTVGAGFKYGLDKQNPPNVPFFNSIEINVLHSNDATAQHTKYTLVNPVITELSHDSVDQSDGQGTMKTTMRLDYEAVLYNRGNTAEDNPADFATNNYDKTPSPYASSSSNETDQILSLNERAWQNSFFDNVQSNVTYNEYEIQRNENIKKRYDTNPVSSVINSLLGDIIIPNPSRNTIGNLYRNTPATIKPSQPSVLNRTPFEKLNPQQQLDIGKAYYKRNPINNVEWDNLPDSIKEESIINGAENFNQKGVPW